MESKAGALLSGKGVWEKEGERCRDLPEDQVRVFVVECIAEIVLV